MRQPSRGHQKRTSHLSKGQKAPSADSRQVVSSNIESMAMDLVQRAGEKGLLQTDLLKKLGTDNRRGTKLISGLEEQGLIRKSKELYRGKWTYRIGQIIARTPVLTWGDMDCPCFFCNDSGRCGLGNVVSPSSCSDLSGWLKSSIEERGSNQANNQPA